jgi:predicted DCC family thiol-disulfide oxidoreductase YuxK
MTDDIPRDRPILLFDGVCNLCHGTVQFLIEHDPEGRLRFASLQSPVGKQLLADVGLDAAYQDSVVLIDGDDCYRKSDAALRAARYLDTPLSLGSHLEFVPRFLRDGVYDLVAETRYDVFGKRDRCLIPSPDLEDRFLDEGIAPTGDGAAAE